MGGLIASSEFKCFNNSLTDATHATEEDYNQENLITM